MRFSVLRPCSNCPFRRVGAIDLHPERLPGIVADLLADDHEWFACHKTTAGRRRRAWSQCAGSMVYLLKIGRPSLSMRLAVATGLLDLEALRAQAGDVIDPSDVGPAYANRNR